jgi:hypothetical protein
MSIQSRSQKIVIWILLAESILIISTRMGAFLHEFIGHGLMAELFGGRFEAFKLTLFAGGEAKFSGEFGEIATICVALGGIGVNFVTGFSALIFIQKKRLSFAFTLLGIFLAGVSILSQIQYLVLGAYYQYGDPACLAKYPIVLFLAWTGGVIALAYFSWYLMRLFFQFQDVYFPTVRLLNRSVISFWVLVIPILMYAGLYHYFKVPLGSTAAVHEARLRALKEAERIKIETKSEKSVEEIRKELEPYPILPWILSIYFFTALMAFLHSGRPNSKKYFPHFPLSFLNCLPWLITSGIFLIGIALLFI